MTPALSIGDEVKVIRIDGSEWVGTVEFVSTNGLIVQMGDYGGELPLLLMWSWEARLPDGRFPEADARLAF